MFETSKIIIKENSRNLITKIKESPVLYFIFSGMTLFSIIIFSFASYYFIYIDTNFNLSLEDLFFTIFFVFMLKTTADVHTNYIKSAPLSYTLSTQKNQKKTVFEIFIAVLITQLIIWFSFSALYLITLSMFRINVYYPIEYFQFTLGVIAAVFIGFSICINFFSTYRIRLIPSLILFALYFQGRHPLYVLLTIPLAVIHAAWSVNNSISSYLFAKRKERTKDRVSVKMRGVIKAIFYRETTVLWRDKLLLSFIITSISTGLFSGYLYLYGDEILIPEYLRETMAGFLPSMFLYLSIFIVVMYTAVFPSLNLFLNEEKTMWLVRHIPIKNDVIIFGKTSALSLCFLTAIPVIPYISIFIGLDNLFFLVWFLCFSYIAGVIISVPLGVKYVGKKSDIILLYSVAMILFIILGGISLIRFFIDSFFEYPVFVYILILLLEILILYISLKLSSQMLSLEYKSNRQNT